MASRIFTFTARRAAAAGAAVIGTGAAGTRFLKDREVDPVEAKEQFEKSWGFKVKGVEIVNPPEGWTGPLFKIKNDYPKPPRVTSTDDIDGGLPALPGPDRGVPSEDLLEQAPWLKVNFRKHPEKFCDVIKEYCWEGNVNNDFNLHKNNIREWYHAPWMHWNQNGREPLNGLTFERPTPAFEFSNTQDRQLQTWACGFYNRAGASLFGRIWADPAKPKWDDSTNKFPLGTCVFKILMTDAKDHEVPTMKNAPSMKAVVAPDNAMNGAIRNKKESELRLLQVDFAVRDERAPIGWVFGTFMYDGNHKDTRPWYRIIPVGIMWGNDPNFTTQDYKDQKRPQESWINPEADEIRKALRGQRPTWGWNGRMNGPADNYVSACASCHSVSETQWKPGDKEMKKPEMIPKGTDEEKLHWFRNIPAGKPFTEGYTSGDYSLQLMMGFYNFQAWVTPAKKRAYGLQKYVIPSVRKQAETIEASREPLRAAKTPEQLQAEIRK